MLRIGPMLSLQLKALLAVLVFVPLAKASIESGQEFQKLLNGQDKAPVIIMLKMPADANSASDELLGDGQWLNFNQYLAEAQRKFAKDMNWVNLNDLVNFKQVPAVARAVTAAEFNKLSKSKLVAAVYPDKWNTLSLDRSNHSIGLAELTSAASGGQGVTVAVVDSGVDANHPFLENRVVDGACFSAYNSCPGAQRSAMGISAGRPCLISGCEHGTHVAGIIAGKNDKFSGVAAQANLLAVNVFSVVQDQIGAADSDIIQALEWVYINAEKYNVAAVNMSLGGGSYKYTCDDDPVSRIIRLLLTRDVVSVIAAGNDGYPDKVGSPGCISDALTVGSLDPNGKVSAFSNSYKYLDIVAPGGQILSSVPGQQYKRLSGTSMAAPQVAGAVALLKAQYANSSAADIIQALQQGQSFRDPRNGLQFASLYLPDSANWLAANAKGSGRSAPDPKQQITNPPSKNKPCSRREDGILIEDLSGDCQPQGEIKW